MGSSSGRRIHVVIWLVLALVVLTGLAFMAWKMAQNPGSPFSYEL
jgi:hypothetical protein